MTVPTPPTIATLLVIAKQPVPGRVKTRLVPPCTHEQAAVLAEAALADTLHTVLMTPARRRILVGLVAFFAVDSAVFMRYTDVVALVLSLIHI